MCILFIKVFYQMLSVWAIIKNPLDRASKMLYSIELII
jgi:hypothetical protein